MQEIQDTEKITALFEFVKNDGSPGDIDLSNPPSLVSSDDTACTGALAADAKSAVLTSGDNLAIDTPVHFELRDIDVDLGAGVQTINIGFDLLVKSHTAQQVTNVNVTFGPAEPK